ncbi:hypothetical protein C2759_04680 [Polynucleobacter sp. MG-Unter2-18]|uniref:hypothetical protein n=1 Tax=Polynucleobacter sp. MG-Unter2-18 TaxID=2081052 RepID=UPI001BFE517A|nr:hypothetical protein [Polynucleobacter sp. MG-Unter2-18]QWD95417.1 hypothetical protein C2759_04680 [Polynucleobacter sp. MG-Unter2-18]
MRVKELLNGLNGWQRLFAGFLIFIYLPITFVIVSDAGRFQIPNGQELTKIMPDQVLNSLHTKESILQQMSDGIDWDLATEKDYKLYRVGDPDRSWEYALYVSNKIEPAKAKAMADDFSRAMKSYAFRSILIERLATFIYFLVGAICIYAFGLTLAWIYRGFKRGANG